MQTPHVIRYPLSFCLGALPSWFLPEFLPCHTWTTGSSTSTTWNREPSIAIRKSTQPPQPSPNCLTAGTYRSPSYYTHVLSLWSNLAASRPPASFGGFTFHNLDLSFSSGAETCNILGLHISKGTRSPKCISPSDRLTAGCPLEVKRPGPSHKGREEPTVVSPTTCCPPWRDFNIGPPIAPYFFCAQPGTQGTLGCLEV
ncbi:hypothetical protein CONLIGDRAFT_330999 [Coniochaeta ligniaria NRRL 30616]|uniref:Uncharacterized protein n=1 Tax=Coniochaeta ligniaria NRRL 30616 TaxID=1408157 RepID=A0A1J7J875_9PEZI|nr:hypothetical protein CONLIGDRAFT_330999 [Coniochaeta ligniaria NRRL 30616]